MKVNIKLLVAETIGYFALFGVALFLPAGTLAWVPGWVFLGMFFVFFVGVNWWLIRNNPGLAQERLRLGRSDQKGWDKVFFPFMLAISLVWLIFMPLDSVRFKWSHMPVWLQVVGAVVLLGSFFLLFLTFRENSYLSTVVRVQEDRGHTVISTGPYHYVRHPMYSSFIPFTVGTSLLLGSWYGVLLGLVFVAAVARRAVLEERTLLKDLKGYDEYMAKVRYRLIPFVW